MNNLIDFTGLFGVGTIATVLEAIGNASMSFIANICAYLVEACIKLMQFLGLDTSILNSLFPIFGTIFTYVTMIGLTLTVVLFICSLLQMVTAKFTGSELPADNPYQLVGRTVFALILVYFFAEFYNGFIMQKVVSPLFDEFASLSKGNVDWFSKEKITAVIFGGFNGNIGNSIVLLIFFIYLCILLFKFLFYHIEKFFFNTFLIYVSPLAAATYVSKKTSNIWKNYVSLLAVNSVSLLMNIITVLFIESGLSNLINWDVSADSNGRNPFKVTFGVMFLCAVAKVGKKMSVYIGQLFNMNGMSDQVRAGLGEVTGAIATGAMIASRGKGMFGNKDEHSGRSENKRIKDTEQTPRKNPTKLGVIDTNDGTQGDGTDNGTNPPKTDDTTPKETAEIKNNGDGTQNPENKDNKKDDKKKPVDTENGKKPNDIKSSDNFVDRRRKNDENKGADTENGVVNNGNNEENKADNAKSTDGNKANINAKNSDSSENKGNNGMSERQKMDKKAAEVQNANYTKNGDKVNAAANGTKSSKNTTGANGSNGTKGNEKSTSSVKSSNTSNPSHSAQSTQSTQGTRNSSSSGSTRSSNSSSGGSGGGSSSSRKTAESGGSRSSNNNTKSSQNINNTSSS